MKQTTNRRRAGSRRLWALATGVSRALALCSGLVLLALAAATAIDVFGRQFFGAPLRGAIDIVGYGVGLAIALALPYSISMDAHTTLNPATKARSDALGRSVSLVVFVCSLAFLVVLTHVTGLYMLERRASGDEMWILRLPVWPVWAVIAASLAVAVCVHIARAFRPSSKPVEKT